MKYYSFNNNERLDKILNENNVQFQKVKDNTTPAHRICYIINKSSEGLKRIDSKHFSKIPILSQKSGFLLKESGFAMAEADCDLYIISPEFSLNPAQQKLRKAVEVNT